MRHTILVIDDQWSMQEYARLVLQTAGYRVLLASDVVTGLSLARIEHPDAIVMDSRLPDMGGTDLLRMLRQDAHTAAIPVIFITQRPQELPSSFDFGLSSILQKPFQPPALLNVVEQLLVQPEVPVAV